MRAADRGLRGLTGPCEARTVLRRQVRCGINQIGEPANVMFRMADYARTTGWNAHRVYPMDAQLWVELLRLGRLYAQPQTYAAFRLSGSNLSASHSAEQYAQTDELLGEVAREWGIPRWQGALGRLARRAVWAAWRIRIKLLARSGAAR